MTPSDSSPRGPAEAAKIPDPAELQDRRRAVRALLRRPLLTAEGGQASVLALVRRHAPWLKDWFQRHPGWRLEVSSELARLRKVPATLDDGTRPAREPVHDTPFSRRRYVLLCLAIAVLERSERQTTLGNVAQEILGLAAADEALAAAGVPFDLDSRDQRRDLVQVMRFLLDLQVLVRVHGDETQYLDGRGDVLYDIRRPVLAALLNVRRGPSTIDSDDFEERLRRISEEPLPDSEEGYRRRRRSRLTRQLLDDPLIYYDQLAEDELVYLHSQRPALLRQIQEATGLEAEVRREGIAMVDPRGDWTDLGLPEQGTDGHLTLLLAEYLAAHSRREPGLAVGLAELGQHLATLIAEHRKHWAKRVCEPGAEPRILAQVLDKLEALSLVLRTEGGVLPAPAIGRFALGSLNEPEES